MVKIGDVEIGNFPLILAPMEDVSDPPFRVLCKEMGADLMFTEFISTEGLIRNAAKSNQKLDFFELERPLGIQIFGAEENSMVESAKIIEGARPDILDINFGCPVKKVVSKGAGAGILQDIPKMVYLTNAVVKNTKLPVTVKTRIGWDEESKYIVDTAERLQDVGIKAISIHGRTRSQMYKGDADWSLIEKVKNNQRMKIPVFGNGDIDSPEKLLEYKNRYSVDGIMVGRATIGNPWFFRMAKEYINTGNYNPIIDLDERIRIVKKHLEMSIKWKGENLAIIEMKKHYSNYFRNIPNFKDYKLKLMNMNSIDNIFDILDKVNERF